jgi:hypothetical protein
MSQPEVRTTPKRTTEPTIFLRLKRHSLFVFLALTGIASARIVSTYNVFSQTYDEPAHIACGMEWLSEGVYRYEPQHPPLARVAAALGPYLAGLRSHRLPGMWDEGMALLSYGGHYDRNLSLARLGVLPFFWVASLVVYLWGKRCLGEPGATLAVLFFTFLPPILAHAGLATTDMALTAMVGATFLTALIWFDRPTLRNSLVFGGVSGVAVLVKFSSLAFLPVAFVGALIWYVASEQPPLLIALQAVRKRVPPLCLAAMIVCLAVWTGYRFSFGHVPFTSMRLPAPELYAGVQQVIDHNRNGDPAYLLGGHSSSGWWYYYLVVLTVKTPLPFLASLIYGAVMVGRGYAGRGAQIALVFSLSILWFALTSRINLGVRHILPVYIGFSLVAAGGAANLLERSPKSRRASWALGILMFWMVATSALSHPDYLPYFNAIAGTEPEQVLVDSDLDWGQDMKRLARRLHDAGAQQVSFTESIPVDLAALGFPPVQPNDPVRPLPGWNAVSVTILKNARLGLGGTHPEIKLWPEQIKPAERIGKGIWLWYFPP